MALELSSQTDILTYFRVNRFFPGTREVKYSTISKPLFRLNTNIASTRLFKKLRHQADVKQFQALRVVSYE